VVATCVLFVVAALIYWAAIGLISARSPRAIVRKPAPPIPIVSAGKVVPLTPEMLAQAKQPPVDSVTATRIITGDFAIFARPGKSCRVVVFLNPGATHDDQELAQQVKWALERLEPENPGRERTFGRLHWPLPPYVKTGPKSFKRSGWTLVITAVERRPDGWGATVHVGLRVDNGVNSSIPVLVHHTECYTSRGGRITLESEIADMSRQPGDDFPSVIFN
jgi:hypothetical protein